MIHAFNQYQRSKKAEETHFHQKQNALAGYSNGGRPPYGYRNKRVVLKNQRNENQHKVVRELDPENAPAIAHAFKRHAEGVGTNTIAAELNQMGFRSQNGNTFTKNTVRAWFRNPYPSAGCLVWNRLNKQKQVNPFEQWQRVKDAYPAIISYEEADRIFQKTESKKSSPTGNNKGLVQSSKYLLIGLIICPICGKHFVMNSDLKRNQFHYICGTRNRVAQGCENKIWIAILRRPINGADRGSSVEGWPT